MASNRQNKQANYQVFVIDMFDYDNAWMDKEYNNAADAIARAKDIVLRSFSKSGKDGYEEWLRFGESASVISIDIDEEVEFSAQDFVKEICKIRE